MWTYERTADGGRTPYRAFVSIPGHLYENFNRPNYRSILLRGIAWAGKRANVDELLKKDELGDGLRYVEGGPTAPAKAAATIEVHPEFDLTLVAAEPLIQKAMNIDWDERGRLWVSETPEYPNGRKLPNTEPWKDSGSLRRQQDRDPEDTISILSDTNGDGVMDRKHVFADKLELVTGFVFHRSGVIAATSPGHLVSRGHERRRGRGQAHEAVYRPRHSRHARRHQQSSLGTRRLDLRHARIQRRDGDLSGRHEELRPRRERRRALQA